jgi:hypothetical protein
MELVQLLRTSLRRRRLRSRLAMLFLPTALLDVHTIALRKTGLAEEVEMVVAFLRRCAARHHWMMERSSWTYLSSMASRHDHTDDAARRYSGVSSQWF